MPSGTQETRPRSTRWGLGVVDPRPFRSRRMAQVVLPSPDRPDSENVRAFATLLRRERAELEVELGCPVEFVDDASAGCEAPLVLVGPARRNASLARYLQGSGRRAAETPHVAIDRVSAVVVLDGPDIPDVITALQLLRTAIRTRQTEIHHREPALGHDALDLIDQEVRATYPAFALRGIDWANLLREHAPDLDASGGDLPSLQRLFAGLYDAHSWARNAQTSARLPYRVWASPDAAHLVHVPTWSPGWKVGARAGDALISNRIQQWWGCTSATPRTRPLMTGYRMLSGTMGAVRIMRVRASNGEAITWREQLPPVPWMTPISSRILASGTGYLRIRGWQASDDWHAVLEAAIDQLRSATRLLVDLRGNVGGSLIAAQDFRNRFLVGRTTLGTIRFSRGDGTLSDHAPIIGEPPSSGWRWTKPVRFLIDRQTYSASEDAILGLQGLPYVQIVGERSGGGSGRPRTLPIGAGHSISISTALTFDRHGHCIEGNGIPIDRALPVEQAFLDPRAMPAGGILDLADRGW